MKRFISTAIAALALIPSAGIAAETPASTPQATPAHTAQPAPAPTRVFIANPPESSFFPSAIQETGVWQGCGPAQDEGALVDFNREHPHARIVQVFIDASLPCKAAGSHTFVIVYQEPGNIVRRAVRYPMAR